MRGLQIIATVVIVLFYIAYFTKMIFQRRKGIITDQIGKGHKDKKVLLIEGLMKIASYSIVPVELISILGNLCRGDMSIRIFGIVIAIAGVGVFGIAMWTMRDSWRAGIPSNDKTALVTTGIYRMSRNPAFLGFDMMYLGILIAYYNTVHLLFVLFAIIMLHLQIRQEEQYLTKTFGDEYADYKKRTGRYLFW